MARGAAKQQGKLNALGDQSNQNAQNAYSTASGGYQGILANPGFSKDQINTQTEAATTPIAGQVATAQAALANRAAATHNTAGMVSGQRDIARTGAQQLSQAAWGVKNNADTVALSERDKALEGESNLYSTAGSQAGNLYGGATNSMLGRQSWVQNLQPFLSAAGTAACWIAAVVFEEDFFFGPRVNLVRNWLFDDYAKTFFGKFVVSAYSKYGERVARVVEKSSVLKKAFRVLFDVALRKAESKYNA